MMMMPSEPETLLGGRQSRSARYAGQKRLRKHMRGGRRYSDDDDGELSDLVDLSDDSLDESSDGKIASRRKGQHDGKGTQK